MRLTRKLLIPILSLFMLVLLALLVYVYLVYRVENRQEEERILGTMYGAFASEVENMSIRALSLASETANNPAVQEAFAARDRERLTELTQPIFERLQEFNVTQYQFYLPPATSFLRLHDLDRFGDDVSAFRSTVVAANAEPRPVTGVESGSAGPGVRGVVPVFYGGRHIGSVELGIDMGQPLLEHLQGEVGGEWHILLTRESIAITMPEELVNFKEGPTSDLLVFANTQDGAFYSEPEYYARALQGETPVYHAAINGRNYAILSAPLLDYSGNVIGVLDILQESTALVAVRNRGLLLGGLAGIIVLALIGIGMALFLRRTLEPIAVLTAAAGRITAGDLGQEVNISTDDEIGVLSTAFNQMTTRIRNLISGLEERVAERTRDLERRRLELEIVAEVARDITTLRDLDVLLSVAASLIRERFDYYHVGIFLIDERGENAVLQAASSVAAQAMRESRYQLKAGQPGIVGQIASTGLPRIARDIDADTAHAQNPLLPETRSEIGVPLRSRGSTIGVLDIQSTESSAFDEQNIETLQLLADQLVAAIENAQLAQRSSTTVKELNAVYQSQVRQAWDKVAEERGRIALEYDGLQVKPISHEFPTHILKKLAAGQAVVMEPGDNPTSTRERHRLNTLLVPLMALNQVIGVIGLEQEDPDHEWTSEAISVVEAAAGRAAIALENARLLQEAQKRAAKERTIGEISTKLGNLVDLENILQTTIQELSRSLPDAEVAIQLHRDQNGRDPKASR